VASVQNHILSVKIELVTFDVVVVLGEKCPRLGAQLQPVGHDRAVQKFLA
jgi:hypothetical protein